MLGVISTLYLRDGQFGGEGSSSSGNGKSRLPEIDARKTLSHKLYHTRPFIVNVERILVGDVSEILSRVQRYISAC